VLNGQKILVVMPAYNAARTLRQTYEEMMAQAGCRFCYRDQTVPIAPRNPDDFVFDNQILAQVLWLGYRIGEVTCPAKYLPEASVINFRRSMRYGFGCIMTALKYRWAKVREGHSMFLPNE
jgi:hypothetical protein